MRKKCNRFTSKRWNKAIQPINLKLIWWRGVENASSVHCKWSNTLTCSYTTTIHPLEYQILSLILCIAGGIKHRIFAHSKHLKSMSLYADRSWNSRQFTHILILVLCRLLDNASISFRTILRNAPSNVGNDY